MQKNNYYDFLVFDCDGVILDSNTIKTDAFAEALSNEPPKLVSKLLDYHKKNGGITRQNKFEYFFRSIKGEFNQKLYNQALKDFAKICSEKLMKCPLAPGIVRYLASSELPKYVVTGGSETEVQSIFKARSLDQYFLQILGNPASKDSNMQKLKESNSFIGKGLYFGDSLLDFQLANKYGLDFIYIYGVSEWIEGQDFCRAHHLPAYKCFNEFIVKASEI